MNPRDIDDIREAEHLFRQAERSFPSEGSAKTFSEALDTLNDFLEFGAPSDEVRVFASNLKRSYTRTVLQHLVEIDTQNVDVLFHYLHFLLLKAKDEFEQVREEHPALDTAYRKCIERFSPQLAEAFNAALARR